MELGRTRYTVGEGTFEVSFHDGQPEPTPSSADETGPVRVESVQGDAGCLFSSEGPCPCLQGTLTVRWVPGEQPTASVY